MRANRALTLASVVPAFVAMQATHMGRPRISEAMRAGICGIGAPRVRAGAGAALTRLADAEAARMVRRADQHPITPRGRWVDLPVDLGCPTARYSAPVAWERRNDKRRERSGRTINGGRVFELLPQQ